MKTAIVIVTYNGERYLDGLFDTLKAHTALSDVVIVVVDNASSDGTLAKLWQIEREWRNVHVLPQETNTGFTGGNNIGLLRARELGVEYALLLNQDIEVTPGWLEPLVAVMDERPEVAALQPLVLLFDEPELVNSAGNELHFCGFGYCGDYRQKVGREPTNDDVRSVAFASGAALLLRMRALSEAGTFDERLFLYHEDCDLQIRLRQLGYECVVVPSSHVFHKYTAGFSPRKYALLDRNRWFVLLKDWPLYRLLAAAPALVGVELAVLVFAVRQGWFTEKLATYGEIARALPSLVRDRRGVQARRSPSATDGEHLTGRMQFEGLDHPIVTHLANPILSAYWSFARRVLRVP